jgi:hypothetical protein
MSTLQEHLEETYDVDVEEQLELQMLSDNHPERREIQRFIIDDEDKASWALRKLAKIKAEADAASVQLAVEQARLADWFAQVTGPLDRQRGFFLGLLREFHEQQLASDPSKKTIKLPAGILKSIAGQNKWTIDEDEFLGWFDADLDVQAAMPELVRTKREPALKEIKSRFEPRDDRAVDPSTGEVVPGVTVAPGQRSFSVEVAE